MSDQQETEAAFWRRHCKEAESQNQALQEERDSLVGDIADSWAPRVQALQERAEKAEEIVAAQIKSIVALQERCDKAMQAARATGMKLGEVEAELWKTTTAAAEELAALQERAERLENGLRQMASEPDRPGPDHAAFAKSLLSSTQETDPGCYGQKSDDEEFLRDFLATQEAIVEAPIDYSMNPNALEESLAQIYALSSYAIENYSTSMTDNVYATLDHINGIARRYIKDNPPPGT